MPTETSLFKQYDAGERVDLLVDDYCRFVLETLPSNYFSSFHSFLFLPFREGPQFCLLRFLP